MKINRDSKYWKWGLTAFAVIAAGVCFFYLIFHTAALKVAADDPLFVWPIPRNELEAPGSQIQPNESNR